MPVYIYEAINIEGKKVKGEIIGASSQEAFSSLMSKILFPLNIIEKKANENTSFMSKDILKKGVNKKHVAIFTRQFASMLKAGVPLPAILDVLIKQERNTSFKEILKNINSDILAGNTLSSSLSKFKVFPKFLVSMAAVGEANGRLDMAFERVAISLEKELKLASKVRGALIYPAVLLSVSIIVSIILTFVVLPTFSDMFKQMGVQLPVTTIAFINVSSFITTHWYILGTVIFITIIIILKLFNEPALKEVFDKFILSIPVIGRVQNIVLMARFCRTFSSLADGGVDIITSLETVRNVMNNLYVKNKFSEIIGEIQSGSTLSYSVSKFDMFTPLVVSMIRIGEESGRLGDILSRTADFYEDESDSVLQRLTAMAEPLVTVIMSLGVGFIVLSIVQPMFEMYKHLGG